MISVSKMFPNKIISQKKKKTKVTIYRVSKFQIVDFAKEITLKLDLLLKKPDKNCQICNKNLTNQKKLFIILVLPNLLQFFTIHKFVIRPN